MVTIAEDLMIANKLKGRKQEEEIKQWQRSLFVSLFAYTKLFLLHNVERKLFPNISILQSVFLQL